MLITSGSKRVKGPFLLALTFGCSTGLGKGMITEPTVEQSTVDWLPDMTDI